MKKSFYMFTVFLIFSCSSTDDSNNEKKSTSESLNNNSEYILPQCNDFAKINDNLLLLLRTLGYDTNDDGKISCSEANSIINLNLGDDNRIINLDGIESLKNLEIITGAVYIEATVNLFNNTKLKEINFNVLSKKGTSRINTLILPNGNSLVKLDCSFTSTFQVKNITNQSNLKIIRFAESTIQGELDLSNCSSLEEIRLPHNKLDAIKLTSHNSLKILEISGEREVPRLKEINTIGLPNLEELYLTGNLVTNLNLSKNERLKILNLTNNKLPTINLKNNLLLEDVILNLNLLGSLDLSSNINLKRVKVTNNYLTYLNLKNQNNDKITEMDATSNNNLVCIQIDKLVPHGIYWKKDSKAVYSIECK
jgi:hypothetical protein